MLVLLLITGMTISVAQQQSEEPLPQVTSAAVPFYPPAARVAGIQGAVLLRIATDGKQILEVHVVSGQPMLARAAKENVKTWQLREHTARAFEATFEYRLLSEWECHTDSGLVLLRLPAEVEVTSKRLKTCDPAVENID